MVESTYSEPDPFPITATLTIKNSISGELEYEDSSNIGDYMLTQNNPEEISFTFDVYNTWNEDNYDVTITVFAENDSDIRDNYTRVMSVIHQRAVIVPELPEVLAVLVALSVVAIALFSKRN